MRNISEYQREKRTKWSSNLSIFSLFVSIPLAYGIYISIPPISYLFISFFGVLIITTFFLAISGLKSGIKQIRSTAIIALVFAAISTAILLIGAINSFKTNPEKIVFKQIEDVVSPVCFGEIISGTGLYNPEETNHFIVAINDSSNSIYSKYFPFSINWIPEKYWPAAVNETDLVLCMGKEYQDKIQGCGYTNGISMERFQFKRDVRLISIWNGEIIDKGVIEGSLPEECPEVTSRGGKIKGDRPGVTEVQNWLQLALDQ